MIGEIAPFAVVYDDMRNSIGRSPLSAWQTPTMTNAHIS